MKGENPDRGQCLAWWPWTQLWLSTKSTNIDNSKWIVNEQPFWHIIFSHINSMEVFIAKNQVLQGAGGIEVSDSFFLAGKNEPVGSFEWFSD